MNELLKDWRVFPIAPGRKNPPLLKDWEHHASNDPKQIEKWKKQFPGCNWGGACGPSKKFVVDVDPKHGGDKTFDELQEVFGFPPTRVHGTPHADGRHHIYEGDGKTGAGKLGPGLDTRGKGGYVLLPPSVVDGKTYTRLNDRPYAPVPHWILEKLGAPSEKKERVETPACELDDVYALSTAAVYLREQAPIDVPAYEVACRVRDLGVSEDTCFILMWDHYAARCDDPWEPEVLRQKVANAYRYAQNQLGVDAPATIKAMFEPIADDPPVEKSYIPIIRASDLDLQAIPRREWILGRRYIRGFVTLTVAPGGQGKSTLVMLEAASIASGKPLTGDTVYAPGPVWIYNTEDPQDELSRRIAALAIEHKLSQSDLTNLLATSGHGSRNRLTLVKDDPAKGLLVNVKAKEAIINTIEREGIILFVVDPFVRSHGVNENDNSAIDRVVEVYSEIAERTGCAIGIVHHTRKGKIVAGDMDSARGASSLISAARIAHTLAPMGEKEREVLRIDERRAQWFVRLDDAKANLSPPDAGARWFERVSVGLPSGDCVGAMKAAAFAQSYVLEGEDLDLATEVFQRFTGNISAAKMGAALIQDGRTALKRVGLTKKLLKIFTGGQIRDGLRITTVLREEGGRNVGYLIGTDENEVDFL